MWRRNPFVIAFAALAAGKGSGLGVKKLKTTEYSGRGAVW